MVHSQVATQPDGPVLSDRLQLLGPPDLGAPCDVVSVLVAHPHALVRAGLRALLEAGPGISVDGEAAGAEGALVLAHRTEPDVVVIDAGADGPAAAWRIVSDPQLASVRVLILGSSESDESLTGLPRIGLEGYLHKDCAPIELRNAV